MRQESESEPAWAHGNPFYMVPHNYYDPVSAPVLRARERRRGSWIHVTPARRAVQKAPPRKKACNQRVKKQNFHPACSLLPISSLFRRCFAGLASTKQRVVPIWNGADPTFSFSFADFPNWMHFFFSFFFVAVEHVLRFFLANLGRLVWNFGTQWLYFSIPEGELWPIELNYRRSFW